MYLSRSYDLEEKREKRREKNEGRDTRTRSATLYSLV